MTSAAPPNDTYSLSTHSDQESILFFMPVNTSTRLRDVLAKNVRLIRNRLGLSQEQLANESGLHRTYIGSIERGERNVSVDNIEKIARALNVKATVLLVEEGR